MFISKILSYIKEKGIVYSIENFVDVNISHIAPLSESTSNSIFFVSKNLPSDFSFNSGACIVKNYGAPELRNSKNIIAVDNPRLVIILIAQLFKPYFSQEESSISSKAIIHPSAQIGKNVIIMDNVILGNCSIGDYTIIYPNVVIYDKTEIGSFCEINANTTIGAEGMGSEKFKGKLVKFPHFSKVVIKDDVFIGPNVTISRGVLTPTIIETGCRINTLSHIAHNVCIGKNVNISIGVIVCGSVKIGYECSLAPNCTIRDGIMLLNNVKVGMGAVVTKSFYTSNITLVGVPAKIF